MLYITYTLHTLFPLPSLIINVLPPSTFYLPFSISFHLSSSYNFPSIPFSRFLLSFPFFLYCSIIPVFFIALSFIFSFLFSFFLIFLLLNLYYPFILLFFSFFIFLTIPSSKSLLPFPLLPFHVFSCSLLLYY